MTSYEDIFKSFLRKISDIDLADRMEYNSQAADEDMIGWLHSAVTKIGELDHDQITFDDTCQTIAEDLSDWEIEIYALGMRVEWLGQYIETTTNLKQVFSSSEENFFSQSSQLKQLQALRDADKLEIRKLIRDRGYRHNEYLDGTS